MRRRTVTPHKSLRHLPFDRTLLAQAVLSVITTNLLLLWSFNRLLRVHSRAVETLLAWAEVPWQTGREMLLLPGISAPLLRTSYVDYGTHPLYPICIVVGTLSVFVLGYRRWPTPLKPLFFVVPAALALTWAWQRFFPPGVPYTPEDFCAIWYRGEAYLWLLLPVIFAATVFLMRMPLYWKVGWLSAMMVYSFIWSVVRLAVALATFHYFGSLWMPLFYFGFGFLADFVYIVAFYSVAVGRATASLGRQAEAWQFQGWR
ncbi:MAG: hypothetical protein HYX72_06425 [Acidobacteria bacterium]|nr:hypothetical protein [Acidobacteriota bacterium]